MATIVESSVMSRRALLRGGGAALLGSSAGCGASPKGTTTLAAVKAAGEESRWAAVRDDFDARRDYIHMAGMIVASHPKPVREAIERHRRALDEDPAGYVHQHWAIGAEQLPEDGDERARRAAGRYLQADPAHIALTDSTTMGLALVYNGLDLRPGDELLEAHWNHKAAEDCFAIRAQRSGWSVRRATLYDDPANVSVDRLVDGLLREIRPNTRILAMTFVHSHSGLRFPVAEVGARVRELNRGRDARDRILVCVDGVHGFGVEDIVAADLNCDFFIAGCHKWLFGPRGTGIVWGSADGWSRLAPTFPSFDLFPGITPGRLYTPGGFHSFEHRWALDAAFDYHLKLGKRRIQDRIHELARHAREGLAKMKHVRMRTPNVDALTAGMACFEVDGHTTKAVLEHLHAKKIVASSTPEMHNIPRLSPGLMNDHGEVERTLEAIAALA
jgi:selenocysteine lyase/cysteine desulfurase